MLVRKGKFSLVLPVLFLVQGMAWAENDTDDNAGRVKFANGNVRIVSSGSEQLAHKGSLVKEGDTIVTDIGGLAQLDMKDKGIISVRSDSQLQIVTYKMNSNGDGGRVVFNLLKGAFRSITGLIGIRTPENYAVETPTATIGVRGTDHEPQFVPPGGWSGAPGRPAGTYDTVYSGHTVISTKGGRIEVAPGQTGYAPRQDAAPIQVSISSMRQIVGNQKSNSQDGTISISGTANTIKFTPGANDDTIFSGHGVIKPNSGENFSVSGGMISTKATPNLFQMDVVPGRTNIINPGQPDGMISGGVANTIKPVPNQVRDSTGGAATIQSDLMKAKVK